MIRAVNYYLKENEIGSEDFWEKKLNL